MNSIRRWILAGAAIMLSCEPAFSPSVRFGLERGETRGEQWVVEGDSSHVSMTTAISLGYLERLRLGLGSPFRLADQALHDPRLSDSGRRDVAWAILANTIDRSAYAVDTTVFDGLVSGSSGVEHVRRIENAILAAVDPRAGEFAVRLAYMRAASAGEVEQPVVPVAIRVAALIRDRELARSDALRLLRLASDSSIDPLARIPLWRNERILAVEAPPISRLPEEVEASARLQADSVRASLGNRVPASESRAERRLASWLAPAAAARLAEHARAANVPPLAPITVTLAGARSALLDDPSLSAATIEHRVRFMENAVSEESFVAEYALLRQRARTAANGPAARTLASVAVALRAYAQEPVWFDGFPAPSQEALIAEHGLLDVTFAQDVPEAWRPYYRRMLDLALTDLRGVLPALDLTGLRIDISRTGIRDGMLALHDPRRRRLVLPPESGAGTIAHEIAHDLDGQVALRRYGIRGDYASDGAVRAPRDPLALRLTDLARTANNVDAIRKASSHSRRPAEILARSVEWFVAAALAQNGRSNGYLTSIQDDYLTGYGSARAPDPDGDTADALVGILDEVAPLEPATRLAFLARYGPQRPTAGTYAESPDMHE